MAARPSVTLSPNDPKTAAALRLGERVQSGAARIAPWPTVQRLAVGAVYDKSYAAAAAGAEAGDVIMIIEDVGEDLDESNLMAMPSKLGAVKDLPGERPQYLPTPPPGKVDNYLVAKRSVDKKVWVMQDVPSPPGGGTTCRGLLEAMGVPPEYGWLVRHGNACCIKPQVIAATLHRLLPPAPLKNPLLVWPANRGRVGGWEQRLLVVPGAPHSWLKLSLRQEGSSGGAAATMHVDPTCGQYGIDEPYKEPAASLGLLNEANFKAIAGPLVDDLQYEPQWLARILERLGLANRLSYAIVPARLVLEANGKLDEHVPPGAMLPAWVLNGAGPMPGLPAFEHGRGTGGGAAAPGMEGVLAVWL
ncbi:hypothetical protein HYH03_000802 [Edaphochlamys debaryana]|uniref:Uncharacterized protein n=1 Tax=Edaphochlamys debaryana TaxID=47281 RepID=A0A836C5J9_9CHLO|nr:hypothetical protein HYH03_000802 [Edaphochlamys debaryana]|eukprot:KAG2500980.1 hypothetical protein HYH03_000802 [Edaphochlamys debaryana]